MRYTRVQISPWPLDFAGVMELLDIGDLKSPGVILRAGWNPAPGTKKNSPRHMARAVLSLNISKTNFLKSQYRLSLPQNLKPASGKETRYQYDKFFLNSFYLQQQKFYLHKVWVI